ncbi:hypothetical protein F4695_000572 [Rhizobium soli]|uniref:Uncharacterized protein n=1 Tax=Rhizobium soli TaxID=424798 RepID=A0A7X0JGR5_9HYPH|nr:hypothetical protein [Rhizobium soli]MBB6507253.1 hypothetical protein [Rhizobium soli]
MTNVLITQWLAASLEAKSHRQMFWLALEIGEAGGLASTEMRKAARKVVRSLRDVIELPIAEASVLAKADQLFAELVEILKDAASGTPPLLAA